MSALVALVITACVIADAETCARFVSPSDVTLSQCVLLGQVAAAQWAEDHPKWRVVGWTCRIGPQEKAT